MVESSHNPVLALLFGSALGLYVIYMARRFYSRPDDYIARWQNWLPQKPWTWRLVRGWALFCTWAGTLLLCTSAMQLIQPPPGVGRILLVSVITLSSTYALLPRDSASVGVMKAVKRR